MANSHLWEAKRQQLENKVIEAALNLLKFTNADSFQIRVPNTSPPAYVTYGDQAGQPPLEDMGE